MTVRNALAGIAVADFDAAVHWYTRLLDREPDKRPMPGVAEWCFSGGGCLQVFVDVERAGSSSVTLATADMGGTLDDLAAKDVAVAQTTATEDVKTATVHDPEGNRVVYAEALSDAVAS